MFLFITLQKMVLSCYQMFKYISCSYSSQADTVSALKVVQFKYISCSYSSIKRQIYVLRDVCLNTSHVLIHPELSGKLYPIFTSLNTSHVLIHPQGNGTGFIRNKFKYISCSYSSGAWCVDYFPQVVFKYISCSYSSGTRQHRLVVQTRV